MTQTRQTWRHAHVLPGQDVSANFPADLMTADQLLVYDAGGRRTELVGGRLAVREPAGYQHGSIAARILIHIATFLEHDQATRAATHPLGEVLTSETGFLLQRNPDTVRAPDVAFVAYHRIPTVRAEFAEMAPDLVVEVLSPNDRPGAVLNKVADWLSAGTDLVWVIDPARRLAHVYRADGSVAMVDESSALLGDETLPGFTLPLASVFASSAGIG